MYQKLETDLKALAQYELSWLGKINSIKMTLLLRLTSFSVSPNSNQEGPLELVPKQNHYICLG